METATPLMLTSSTIPPGSKIPAQYACDGADISPPLSWSGIPEGTRSLVLAVEDPDAPSGVFRHWVVFDIPPAARGLDAGIRLVGRPPVCMKRATISASPATAVPVRPVGTALTIITSGCWRSVGRASI